MRIRDGDGGHTELGNPRHHGLYPQQPINEGIFGMKPVVNERGHGVTLSHLGVRQQALNGTEAAAMNR